MARTHHFQMGFNCLVMVLLMILWVRDAGKLSTENPQLRAQGGLDHTLPVVDRGSAAAVEKAGLLRQQYPLLDGDMGTHSPKNLPSVRISGALEEAASNMRKSYGGKGDKIHLGGFRPDDQSTRSNNTWNFMMGHLGIKSVVDVGCGVGVSTKYFMDHGARVLCVEGSHDAVSKTLLPRSRVVEHDFTRGPYWPEETFDAAWSVEFVEHVGRQFQKNYIPIFRRSAMIFLSFSVTGGHHHSEIRPEWWWIARMEAAGFVFSRELTDVIRMNGKLDPGRDENGKKIIFYAQYITLNMLVFINPKLSSKPEHAHLISGHGCLWGTDQVPCDQVFKWHNPAVDTPPKQHQALLHCKHTSEWEGARNIKWSGGPWSCEPNPLA